MRETAEWKRPASSTLFAIMLIALYARDGFALEPSVTSTQSEPNGEGQDPEGARGDRAAPRRVPLVVGGAQGGETSPGRLPFIVPRRDRAGPRAESAAPGRIPDNDPTAPRAPEVESRRSRDPSPIWLEASMATIVHAGAIIGSAALGFALQPPEIDLFVFGGGTSRGLPAAPLVLLGTIPPLVSSAALYGVASGGDQETSFWGTFGVGLFANAIGLFVSAGLASEIDDIHPLALLLPPTLLASAAEVFVANALSTPAPREAGE